MKRDLFLTTEKETEMEKPLRPENPDTPIKGVRSNIVQSIRAFRVQDLQETATGLGHHFLYANLATAQSKQDVLDMIAQQFTFPAHFGKNFDALYDCMTDPLHKSGPQPGFIVVLEHIPANGKFDKEAREQLLSRFLVELGVRRNLLEHHHEAGLRARFVQRVGHAVVQRVEVLAEVGREHELLGDHVQHVLLALRIRQIGVQEMLAGPVGRLLKVADAERPNRLNDVRSHALQRQVDLRWFFHSAHHCFWAHWCAAPIQFIAQLTILLKLA
jgi:RNAse (barnase) inhibitor barstar